MSNSKLRAALVLGTLAGALVAGAAGAQVVTRGPYMQTPTPGGVILRWRTDIATDSRVQYGAAPGSLTTNVDDATSTTEHVVPLSGLSANTFYYYSIGSTGGVLEGDDADHHFRTPPVAGTVRPTRIWITGDGGFANVNGMAVRDSFAAYNAGNETDLWILLGDNAYLFGSDTDYQAALFDMHHDMLRQTPVWPSAGNHEAFSSNTLTQTGPYFDMFSLPTLGQAGGVPSGTESYYAFDHANIHFIVLDSEGSATTPGSPMMLWLESDLQATTADWIIAFWHRPPYSKGLLHDSDAEGKEIEMRQNVIPMLETYGVDLVLNGHSHDYERSMLIDGHYGLSPTFVPAMSLDSGSGNPLDDGAYHKPAGQVAHKGAVYVVAGSSSEVRNTTLNHPVMEVGLLELGSLILDVDGDTTKATFLNSLVQTTDTFTLVKAPACPSSPRSGCGSAPRGHLAIKNLAGTLSDKLVWRWQGGALPVSGVGTPDAQTDLAFCLYDTNGRLVGGAISHGADPSPGGGWNRMANGRLQYKNPNAVDAGVNDFRLRPTGTADTTRIVVKAQGTPLALPDPPYAFPVTAQLANLDGGSCWESVFTHVKKNLVTRAVADVP